MKFIATAALALALLPAASAQKLDFKLDAVAAKASEKSEVDLDGNLLKLAMQHGAAKKDKSAGELLAGIQAIHVRNYEFDQEGAYTEQDLEPLRKQVAEGTGWSRPFHSKEKKEIVEVFVYTQGDKITSCLILAAEARELSVVHLTGTLTVAQMKTLVDSHIAYNLADLGSIALR